MSGRILIFVILVGFIACSTASAANLVINEIMQNPVAVTDTYGEWFELYNPGPSGVDINGWTIKDAGSNNHVIDNGGSLTVPAGGYLTLCRNADTMLNGGVSCDYEYSGAITLTNSDDEVILLDSDNAEIDRVEYDGGPNFPDPTGASMELISPSLDNNVGSNWREATVPYGDGDLGTPGASNNGVIVPEFPSVLIALIITLVSFLATSIYISKSN